MSKVFEIITDRIIKKLESGTIPWEKPWGNAGMPKNLLSGRYYRGINTLSLALEAFGSPWWLTKKQAEQLGGAIKTGERYTPCVYWHFRDKEKSASATEIDDADTEKNYRRGILRFYQVYNVEQCSGIEVPEPETKLDFCPIRECEQIIDRWIDRPQIKFGGNRASYNSATDIIRLPREEAFKSEASYYATYFHEAAHSTGHPKRLNRKTLTDMCPFGSTNYSKEELVAELGASYLCGITGIENATIDNSAAYLKGWLRALSNDNSLLIYAAGQAQKAVDHIIGVNHDNQTSTPVVSASAVVGTSS